ncbi:MAG: hypothetical protein J7623_17200 [Chitinophaga sp.]|uniref:hypothetical protein n=1 Tax=Chitinophaga sp. TaxID=1869181 RepID=UPI001B0F1631|nr:hypothetical protein [Chitinophaga sp.]MBO9730380.1 hypothetical protein [Chitinophaga sp.]
MYRILLLLPVLLFSCQEPARQGTNNGTSSAKPSKAAAPVPFKRIDGSNSRDSAVFEAKGITATIVHSSEGMQTIHITQNGKRLINYMRAIDSNVTTIPVPELLIVGTDTSVGFNISAPSARKFFFKIKNNKATYTKTADNPAATDSIKKAPADAGALKENGF